MDCTVLNKHSRSSVFFVFIFIFIFLQLKLFKISKQLNLGVLRLILKLLNLVLLRLRINTKKSICTNILLLLYYLQQQVIQSPLHTPQVCAMMREDAGDEWGEC